MSKNSINIDYDLIVNQEDKKIGFNFFIEINGNKVNGNHPVDIPAILELITKKSSQLNPLREKYFWNCECGIPECARIEPCRVHNINDGTNLFITLPIPCSSNDFVNEDQTGKTYEYWQANHKCAVVKITKEELAKLLWTLSLKIENSMLEYSKEYELNSWPANESYRDFSWPENLPIILRKAITENGFLF